MGIFTATKVKVGPQTVYSPLGSRGSPTKLRLRFRRTLYLFLMISALNLKKRGAKRSAAGYTGVRRISLKIAEIYFKQTQISTEVLFQIHKLKTNYSLYITAHFF